MCKASGGTFYIFVSESMSVLRRCVCVSLAFAFCTECVSKVGGGNFYMFCQKACGVV